MAQTLTTDLVRRAFKSCRNSNAFGPAKLSISHLKHLGPRAIEYITALFNLSVTTCQIPAIWKSSLIIPIPKPGKHTSVGTSYRPISAHPRKYWSLGICPLSTNISKLLQTNTVLDQNTRSPQLCCIWQHISQWDSTRGSPKSNYLRSCWFIGCIWHSLP